MKNKIIFSLFIILCLISCRKTAKRETGEFVKGKLVLGHEVAAFTPCESSKSYWIYDTSGKMDSLYNAEKQKLIDTNPYQDLYCELKVIKEPKATEGFAESYDGMYKVIDVIKIVPLSETTDCDTKQKEYLKGGVDSTWHIVLQKVASSQFYFLLYLNNKQDSIRGNLIQTRALDKENLSLETFESIDTLENKVMLQFNIGESCTDDKGNAHNGSLLLRLNNQEFKGCGDYVY